MAVIDTFLKLMVERGSEKLVLVSDRPPFLLTRGEHIDLSMPGLGGEMLRRIAKEISGEKDENEGSFRSIDGVEFSYQIQPDGSEYRIEILPLGSVSQKVSVDEDPLSRAVADFTQPSSPSGITDDCGDETSPVHPDPELVALLDQALLKNASDLFLSSGKPPRIRRDGLIGSIDAGTPGRGQILGLLPDEGARRELEQSGSVDFAVRWELPDGPRRIRINVFRHLDGVAAALRPIRREVPQLPELSLPEDLYQLATFSSGLVLVTGTAGSGKSTTLAAFVDYLNRSRPRHIITIEDPIEYEHREIKCMIHQREVGSNVESFATGLRAALRESPDVILLGELRDLDTISAALTAAETGHLVLATLHSGSSSTAINLIVDVFPGYQQSHVRTQLALSLRAVLSQRLIPARTGGLIPAIEKLLVTPAVAHGIREGQDHFIRNAMLTGSEEGMITLERSLATLVRKGLIDLETANRTANDPTALQHQLT